MSKKPRISTKPHNKKLKADKICSTLAEHPEGLSPKYIALYTGINVNTIKSLLPKMGRVQKRDGLRGLYTLVDENGHGSLFKWNLHNAILSWAVPGYSGERIIRTLGFNLVNFKFEIGAESKKATLRLSSEYPVNVSSLEVYVVLFTQLIKEHSQKLPETKDIHITSTEFNQDFINLRLDGTNCITADSLFSQFKIYQKKQGLRVEYKTKVPICADSLISMLVNGSYGLETYEKLGKIVEDNKILIDSHKKLYCLIQRFLEKI